MNKNILTIVTALVIGIVIGVVVGNLIPKKSTGLMSKPADLSAFSSATATIQGTITKIDGNKASVKGKQGAEGEFILANGAGVYTQQPGIKRATSSAGLSTANLNKNMMISLNYQNGRFEIVSVSIIPDKRVLTSPAASASGKPK